MSATEIRHQILEAKKRLYRLLLRQDAKDTTMGDLDMMMALVADDEIQALLDDARKVKKKGVSPGTHMATTSIGESVGSKTSDTKPHPCRGCERSTLDNDFNPIKCGKGYRLKGRRKACKSYSIYP
jgi:hypothetical protein